MTNLARHQPRQRKPRERNKGYLGFIASLRCVLCGDEPECAHVRYAETCRDCLGFGQIMTTRDSEDHMSAFEFTGGPCPSCRGTGDHYGKRPTGAGEKPSDWWTLPLCPVHHRLGQHAQHNSGEREWWEAQGIDPLAACVHLQDIYNSSPSRAVAIESASAYLGGLLAKQS